MKWIHLRFLILLVTIVGCMVTFVDRTCVNIALVSMVHNPNRSESINNTLHPDATDASSSFDQVKVSPVVSSNVFLAWDDEPQVRLSYNDLAARKYHWDSHAQGLILSAFYWSYILFMLPIGSVIQYFGEKWVMTFSLVASALTTILTPAFTDCLIATIVARFFLGFAQSGLMPSAYALTNNWLPLKDRALGFACLDAGSTLGCMIAFFASGYLVNSFGWPSIFIASGLLSLLVSLIFTLTVSSRPDHHSLMSEIELNVIKSGGGCKGAKCDDFKKPKATPWLKMISCPAVLATALFKFSESWTYMVFYTKMPAFLKEIVGLDIESNGVINAVTNLFNVTSLLATGLISEKMISNCGMRRTSVRKLFALFSGFAQAAIVALIPFFVKSGLTSLTVVLSLGTFLNGFQGGSDLPLASEMTVNYPAIMYSLMNVVSTSTGFIVPMFISTVLTCTPDDPIMGWNIIFYSSSLLSIISTIVFLIFASAERQAFDFPPDREDPSSLPQPAPIHVIKSALTEAPCTSAVNSRDPDKLVTPL